MRNKSTLEETKHTILEALTTKQSMNKNELTGWVHDHGGGSRILVFRAIDAMNGKEIKVIEKGKERMVCLPMNADRVRRSGSAGERIQSIIADQCAKLLDDLILMDYPEAVRNDQRLSIAGEESTLKSRFKQRLEERCEHLYALIESYEKKSALRFDRPWPEESGRHDLEEWIRFFAVVLYGLEHA